MGITDDPNDPRLGHGADTEPAGQNAMYLVLAEELRAAGFVRPVLRSYVHPIDRGGCGAVTTMNRAIAETYAARPRFYGATFCSGCNMHKLVGVDGEFEWIGTDLVTWEPGGDLQPSTKSISAQRLRVGT